MSIFFSHRAKKRQKIFLTRSHGDTKKASSFLLFIKSERFILTQIHQITKRRYYFRFPLCALPAPSVYECLHECRAWLRVRTVLDLVVVVGYAIHALTVSLCLYPCLYLYFCRYLYHCHRKNRCHASGHGIPLIRV